MKEYAIVTHVDKRADFVFPEHDYERARKAAIQSVRTMMLGEGQMHFSATGEVRDLETGDHDTVFLLEIRDIIVRDLSDSDKEEPEPKASLHGYAIYLEDEEGRISCHHPSSHYDERRMTREALINRFSQLEPREEEITMRAFLFYQGRLCSAAWLESR